MMRAIVWMRYGPPDVLRLKEVAKPVPKDNQVLIRIQAATVTAGDCEVRRLDFFWLYLPIRMAMGIISPNDKILGQEFAGEVVSVGQNVTRFKAGDRVFANTGLQFGAYAEYITMPEDGVMAAVPENMTAEEAAAVPTGGLEALHFIRRANIQPGEKVLVYGAGGSIGTFAVQLAWNAGAEVSAVDRAEKFEMLRGLGAEHVMDYVHEDFTRGDTKYDVILDVIGKSPYTGSINALRPDGRYLIANPSLTTLARSRWTSARSSKKVIAGAANQTRDDLQHLKALIEAGQLKSIIDRRYPLEQVAEAHRYVESGQKKGHVIITVGVD